MTVIIILAILMLLLAALGYLAWYLLAAPQSQALCPAISSGPSDAKAVALTFDDGPGPETAPILDILREHNIRATFFLCGANVERFPDVARRIATEGHCIGNHAYSHSRFLWKSPGWIRHEIERAGRVIDLHTGKPSSRNPGTASNFFRPPYGLRWFGLAAILKLLGLRAVMWNVNSEDWKWQPEDISARVVRLSTGGSIILLHDGVPPNEKGSRQNTVTALPRIIQELSADYQFVTVPQLAELADADMASVMATD